MRIRFIMKLFVNKAKVNKVKVNKVIINNITWCHYYAVDILNNTNSIRMQKLVILPKL